uniref:Uncharacterized protein n=1 Tax=Monopterus albus TaxID=43700 RepID=A0A3Q3JYK4_MONAL
MPSPSFTLDAQLRFHDKWLKIDLQRAFSPEGLSEMWNEMVKDEEITFNGDESAHPGMVDKSELLTLLVEVKAHVRMSLDCFRRLH